MYEVTRQGLKRLEITMNGKLDSEQMKTALDAIVSESEGIEDGEMLYDVVDFHIPSLDAIMIEFSRLPSMFALLGKFSRAAVLTDKTWLKRVSELEGFLIPGLEIKAFNRNERSEAENWLSR